jgi:hypothetical protein
LPIDLNLITGDRERWPDLGPTVNMGCRLVNAGGQDLVLNRLEIVVLHDGAPAFDLAWHLFYSTIGLEHLKNPNEGRITVAGRSTWDRGVQFRCTTADLPNVWPVGAYEFEMLGWVNCRPGESRANVRTRFRTEVDRQTFGAMTHWRAASPDEWTKSGASDRAYGFPLNIVDVVAGRRSISRAGPGR